MLALLLGTYGGLRGVRYELARVRRHHRLLLVSLPRLFFVISLSPHRHYSIGRTIVSSTASIHPHPQPLFTLSLLFLPSPFSLFHRFPNCSRYHTRTRFPISYFASPPLSFCLSLPCRLAQPLLLSPCRSPFVNLSQSPSLPWVQRSSRTDNIHIQVHKTSQNTSINPTLFSRFEIITHHRQSHPIPSSISISICLYLYIDIVHTHISYNQRLQTSSFVYHIHSPTHTWPTLKVCGFSSFSCVYSPSFLRTCLYLPTSCVLHSVIF